jgi:hypothetical protein
MLKGFEFNKVCRVIKKSSLYEQEFELLHEFLPSEHKNLRLEYGTIAEAKNAAQALRRYAKDNKQPLDIKQRNNYIFAVRKEDCNECE